MITGEIKSQIDRIWDAFWSGGISNPIGSGQPRSRHDLCAAPGSNQRAGV